VDQLRHATAEEAAASAVIGDDAILTRDDVQAEEDKRFTDLTDHQPIPEPPVRREIREAVLRQKERMRAIKDADRGGLVRRTVKFRMERKAINDRRRQMGLAVPGRRPRYLEYRKEQSMAVEPPESMPPNEPPPMPPPMQPPPEPQQPYPMDLVKERKRKFEEKVRKEQKEAVEQPVPNNDDGDLDMEPPPPMEDISGDKRKFKSGGALDDLPLSIRKKFMDQNHHQLRR
jgi:hypothetical protein